MSSGRSLSSNAVSEDANEWAENSVRGWTQQGMECHKQSRT